MEAAEICDVMRKEVLSQALRSNHTSTWGQGQVFLSETELKWSQEGKIHQKNMIWTDASDSLHCARWIKLDKNQCHAPFVPIFSDCSVLFVFNKLPP